MATAALAIRISAQIAEFQKAFAETNKTIVDFKGEFDKAKSSVEKTVKGIQDAFKSLSTAAGAMGAAIVGIGLAVGAAVAAFKILEGAASAAFNFARGAISDTAALGDELFTLSQKTGVAVEDLSALKFAAGQTNTSLETITGAVFKMQTNLGKGSEQTSKAIKGLGLSLADLRKQDPSAAFATILKQLGEVPNASQRAAAGVAIFGKSFQTIAQLSQEDLPALIDQAKELGLVMSTETAVAADLFNDKLGELQGRIDGFRQQIGAALLPAVLTFVDVFGTAFSEAFTAATKSFSLTGKSLDTLVIQIGQAAARIIEVLALMVDSAAAWASAWVLQTAVVADAVLAVAAAQVQAARVADLLLGGKLAGVLDPLAAKIQGLRDGITSVAAATLTGGAAIRTFAQTVATAAATTSRDFASAYQRIQDEISAGAKKMREALATAAEGGGTAELEKATEGFRKSLETLTRQIEIAKAAGTPFTELVRLFGKAASEAVPMADALGLSVREIARQVAEGFNLDKATAELSKFRQEVEKTTNATREAIRLRIVAQGIDEGKKIIDTLNDVAKARDRLADVKAAPFARELAQIERARRAELAAIQATGNATSVLRQQQTADTNAYYDHLIDVATGSSRTIVERMRAQGVFTRADLQATADAATRDYRQMLASGLFTAAELEAAFERMNAAIRASGKDVPVDWAKRFRTLVTDLKNIGLDAAHGFAEALGQGIRTGDWSQLENQLKDVLATAFGNAAAAAANFIVPGLGTLLQPIFTALGDKILGWLGLGTKGRDLVKEFAASFGGFDALRARLTDLGAAGEQLWISLTQGVGRNNPEEAQRAIDAITEALERADKGIKTFTAGALQRIQAFRSAFKTAAGESAAELRKMLEAEAPELEIGVTELRAREALDGLLNVVSGSRAEMQEEFSRLGLYAGTAFAETLRDQGLAAALDAAGPLFDELNALTQEFGLSLEGSAGQFAAFFEAAKANQDVIAALEGITLMIQGAGDAAFLTQELFSAFGTDAVTQFDRLIERGVEANQAMAFMQPTLQALWEAQQRFGFETDAATQALIDQGVEQGIVGAHMKDVNQKILDVLVAIAKVFKADLPEGLDATANASAAAAKKMEEDWKRAADEAKKGAPAIEDAYRRIKIPPVVIPGKWEIEPPELEPLDIPGFHHGGIVSRPTLAMIGEAGPEAVIPLRRLKHLEDWQLELLDIPGLQHGGIVRRPTLAMIGEAGPEAVIPLRRLKQLEDWQLDLLHIPGLQHGGIVRSPTLALIGEAGPEAVVPLNQLGSRGQDTTIILEVDGRSFAEVVVPHLPGAVTRLGLGI